MDPDITWYAQSAVRLDLDGARVYIDPYRLPDSEPPADIILVSHHHGDHLSLESIDRVRVPATVVIASAIAAERIPGEVRVLAPGESIEVAQVHILAVPAYNIDKFRTPGVPYHPREEGHVGFVIEVDDLSFYFAADSDVIPEMGGVGPVDYAFLPVGGRTVMTPEEAARAAELIRPSVAIPVHYGAETDGAARQFAALVPDQVRVWIMSPAETR
ncbi:MAG TPA: MBL fold metallo-hydrolase [Thermomicrobiaceae bacterium]|nr:MBL fold metallo-hydrolase [Thermomicrobiaceae bacterium]